MEKNNTQESLFKIEEIVPQKKNINVREIVSISDIILIAGYENEDWMLGSIEDIGLVDDNIILRKKGEKYEVVDGKRRLMSLKKSGAETVSAIILKEDATDVQAAMLTLLKNNARTHNYIAELEALEILQKNGVQRKVIASHLNVSKATVNRLLSLLKLPQPLYTALKKNKISVGVAFEVLKLDEKHQKKATKIYEETKELSLVNIAELKAKMKESMSNAIPSEMFETKEIVVTGAQGGGKTTTTLLLETIKKCKGVLAEYVTNKRTAITAIDDIIEILKDKKIVELTK